MAEGDDGATGQVIDAGAGFLPRRVPLGSTFHEQFTALFAAHHARLFRYLNRLLHDADLAADIAQSAFIKLYQRGEPAVQDRRD